MHALIKALVRSLSIKFYLYLGGGGGIVGEENLGWRLFQFCGCFELFLKVWLRGCGEGRTSRLLRASSSSSPGAVGV